MPTPYRGEIRWFAGSVLPERWLPCHGQLVPVDEYGGLHEVIGYDFGGAGGEFRLPDLRGRVPVGVGNGIAFKQVGGLEKVALSPDQMPVHLHQLAASKQDGDRADPAGNVWARSEALGYSADPSDAAMHPQSLGSAGAGAPHENMMPFLALTPMISADGLGPFDEAIDADIYIGEIRLMAFSQPGGPVPPVGWVDCNDTTYPHGTFSALDDLLLTTYGGDDQNLAVPDLRGRVAIHLDGGRMQGNRGGEAEHQLTPAELAPHTHPALAAPIAGDHPSPKLRSWGLQTTGRGYAAAPDALLRGDSVLPAGGTTAHENRPPYLGLHHRIATSGFTPMPSGQDPAPDPFVGEVRIFAIPFAPEGWADCDGRAIPEDQADVLRQVIGSTYGSSAGGVVVPDLSGRAPLGTGPDAPGLTPRNLGETGGAELVPLLPPHLPAHTHEVRVRELSGGDPSPEGHLFGASQARALSTGYAVAPPIVPLAPAAVSFAGEGQPHNNMPPYLTLRFCIAYRGAMPF
jgi:microcystin-dependent protein